METYLMGVVCCKCGMLYDVKKVNENPGDSVSHGVCSGCKYLYQQEIEKEARELGLDEKGGAL